MDAPDAARATWQSPFRTCPDCGYVYDADDEARAADHERHHEDSLVGIRLDAAEQAALASLSHEAPDAVGTMVVVVPPDAPLVARKIGHRVAVFATRDTEAPTQYDGGAHDLADGATVYLAVAGEHLVGFLVSRTCAERTRFEWLRNADGTLPHVDPDWPESQQPCRPVGEAVPPPSDASGVAYVWTHPRRRGGGVASRLVDTYAARAGVAAADIVWRWPFTSDGGAALAHRRAPDGFWGY